MNQAWIPTENPLVSFPVGPHSARARINEMNSIKITDVGLAIMFSIDSMIASTISIQLLKKCVIEAKNNGIGLKTKGLVE